MAEEAVPPVGMVVMRVCGYRELGSNRWRRRAMALCLIYSKDIYVLEHASDFKLSRKIRMYRQ